MMINKLLLPIALVMGIVVETTVWAAVTARGEVQLQNVSPSVKTVSVRLQGSETNQTILQTLQTMVLDILNQSKLSVERIAVKKAPTPAVPVYENLEIVIGITSAEGQNQPHRVSITLQELGTEGEPQFFDFDPNDAQGFSQALYVYLAERLNLQPKEKS